MSLAGVTCIFAALCYAEFASMVPVAGSAYTYAYATLGELFAWIIGWDLILEYAVGAATVAQRLVGLLSERARRSSACTFPAALAGPPIIYDPAAGAVRDDRPASSNLPAVLIVTDRDDRPREGHLRRAPTFNADDGGRSSWRSCSS